jgi:hypothetical protein
LKNPQEIQFGNLWREIPLIAKIIFLGLIFTCFLVFFDFMRMVAEPGPLIPGEDLYIHVALLILVPVSTLGMFLAAFGYAYYQTCKRNRKPPFWENW